MVENILPPVESKFNDGHPVEMGKFQVKIVKIDVEEWNGKDTPYVMLQVLMYAKDGRLAYETGPDKVFVKGKYTLNMP